MTTERSTAVLGVIADDYTGATDVASALARIGARVRLTFGVPDDATDTLGIDAIVVALKSRHIPAVDAVALSLAAAIRLRGHGIDRYYFKICSTFDSNDEGNIGPVADALLDFAGATAGIVSPASPEHGRTVYQGHLFVGSRLVSESSMRHHPLTPMSDPDLVRVLGRQTRQRVRLVPHEVVRLGSAAVTRTVSEAVADGCTHLIADAVDDTDLLTLATAGAEMPVTTGGAGLARLLGEVLLGRRPSALEGAALPAGPVVVLAGSQSQRTGEQVQAASLLFPTYRLRRPEDADAAIAWLDSHIGSKPILIHSWCPPDERDEGVPAYETVMARLAAHAVARGARRVVVAGGETSGAVVDALDVVAVDVLGEEDRGVPWLVTRSQQPIALLLKSGNFGGPDLLAHAASR